VGAAPGVGVVAAPGSADFAAGSFSGPLMPHETNTIAASETTMVATKRRNIRLPECSRCSMRSMRAIRIAMPSTASLSRDTEAFE
jgi:hypothetical protein